jgi:hypothetical protein
LDAGRARRDDAGLRILALDLADADGRSRTTRERTPGSRKWRPCWLELTLNPAVRLAVGTDLRLLCYDALERQHHPEHCAERLTARARSALAGLATERQGDRT